MRIVCIYIYPGTPHISGEVAPLSIVHGYIEVVISGNTFRAHPCYSKKDTGMIVHILSTDYNDY